MAVTPQCQKTWKDYLRLLVGLLPPGFAWNWSPSSSGRHFLAAWADELARVHAYFCAIPEQAIDLYVGEPSGWCAEDYEHLLLTRFGIEATVFDGIEPFGCESSCNDPLVADERCVYLFVILVDEPDALPQEFIDYLHIYKQSHTDFRIGKRGVALDAEDNTLLYTDWALNNADVTLPDGIGSTYRRDHALH